MVAHTLIGPVRSAPRTFQYCLPKPPPQAQNPRQPPQHTRKDRLRQMTTNVQAGTRDKGSFHSDYQLVVVSGRFRGGDAKRIVQSAAIARAGILKLTSDAEHLGLLMRGICSCSGASWASFFTRTSPWLCCVGDGFCRKK